MTNRTIIGGWIYLLLKRMNEKKSFFLNWFFLIYIYFFSFSFMTIVGNFQVITSHTRAYHTHTHTHTDWSVLNNAVCACWLALYEHSLPRAKILFHHHLHLFRLPVRYLYSISTLLSTRVLLPIWAHASLRSFEIFARNRYKCMHRDEIKLVIHVSQPTDHHHIIIIIDWHSHSHWLISTLAYFLFLSFRALVARCIHSTDPNFRLMLSQPLPYWTTLHFPRVDTIHIRKKAFTYIYIHKYTKKTNWTNDTNCGELVYTTTLGKVI